MGIKQVRMKFQVAANDGVSAQVSVTVGGIQRFSGALLQTVDVMPGQVFTDQKPYSLVQFGLDVPEMNHNSSGSWRRWDTIPDPTTLDFDQLLTEETYPDDYGFWTTPIDVAISVSGGSVTLQATDADHSWIRPTTPALFQNGSPRYFSDFLRPCSQPQWNKIPLKDRYDPEAFVESGPGVLLVLDNELLEFQLAMTLYCA